MYLPEVEEHSKAPGPHGKLIEGLRAAGTETPEILHLFAYKPEVTGHLERLTQAVMRGPSPLSPGLRELIAAFTSLENRCPF